VFELPEMTHLPGDGQGRLPRQLNNSGAAGQVPVTASDQYSGGLAVDVPDRAEAAEHLIEIRDVSFRYPNGLEAISGFNLAIPFGKVTALVGPSGCGKTTLLRLMAGLTKPTEGAIDRYFAKDARRHPTSVVFQEDTLLPWLTVRQNVAQFYRLHPRASSRQAISDRVNELLAMVDLKSFGDVYPRQLSGGMKRRVAFLAAMAPNPQLLLLDEPFSSVDEPTRVQIHGQVRNVIDRSRMTTVLVTHDLAEAVSLANRVIILSARPARPAAVYDIDFDRSQDLLQLRSTQEFLAVYGRLWDALSQEIRRAGQAPEEAFPNAAGKERSVSGRWRRRSLGRRAGSPEDPGAVLPEIEK
jgi:NitT/TauT family transport system ATP-binding protein